MSRPPDPERARARRRGADAEDQFRRRRTFLLATLAVAAFVAGAWWLLTGPALAIRHVTVSGYTGPNAAAVDTTARLVAGQGTVLDLPAGPMRAALARFPWIEDVHVSRDLPWGITVRITPAVPAAVAVPRRGPRVLVTAAGRVLGPAPERGGLARLNLAGDAPPAGGRITDADARRSLELVRALAPAVAGRLRELRVQDGQMRARLAAGPELKLGLPTDLGLKAQALTAVLDDVPARKQQAAAYLDLRVPEHPALGIRPGGTAAGGSVPPG